MTIAQVYFLLNVICLLGCVAFYTLNLFLVKRSIAGNRELMKSMDEFFVKLKDLPQKKEDTDATG